ncbi:ribonuclease HI [Leptobacterium sp. I13]|uniref:ribonuclease HI n=1 Tax=Leptobacterium meishanense TaxID=3128904 RepID=UPI0030ED95EE
MPDFDVYIYTDGACSGNPGPGGYGIIMEWVGKNYKKEFSEGYQLTTNNRMELMAIIVALSKLKNHNTKVKIFTDSKYVTNAVEKRWVFKWEKNAFKDKKNVDLWIRFLKQYRKHNIYFQWIKGHNHHPENERCDKLAVQASKKKLLLIDKGFNKADTLL